MFDLCRLVMHHNNNNNKTNTIIYISHTKFQRDEPVLFELMILRCGYDFKHIRVITDEMIARKQKYAKHNAQILSLTLCRTNRICIVQTVP